jgi:hypothetical protein
MEALKFSMTNQTQRNYRLGVANGLCYITAETVMDPTLVIVAFLSYLTDSPLLLGLVLPIRDGAWSLPQLWISGYLQSIPNKLNFYRKISYLRIATWVIIALTINFIQEPNLLLIFFFTAFIISSFTSGLAGLPYLEVVGKTIPNERRGEFFAWRFGLGGVGSIGASIFVRWILDPAGPVSFPYNYGILSVIFLILASLSVTAFGMIKEPGGAVVQPQKPLRAQLTRSMQVLQENRIFRLFLGQQSLLMLAGAATPFFAVYVQQRLGGSPAMIGVYLAILTSSNLLANVVFGRMSRKRGNQIVMFIAVLAGGVMSILVLLLTLLAQPLALSANAATIWLIPVFMLVGIRGSGLGVAANSLLLEIAPEEERSLYLGFSNSLLGIVLLFTGLSGVVIALFGLQALVLITLAAHGIAMALSLLIRRPEKAAAFL